MKLKGSLLLFVFLLLTTAGAAQTERKLSGTVVTPRFQLVPAVEIALETTSGKISGTTDGEGGFSFVIPRGDVTAVFSGKNLAPVTLTFSEEDRTTDIQVKINYLVPPIAENVTITDDALTPQIEFRNDALYKNTLFGR